MMRLKKKGQPVFWEEVEDDEYSCSTEKSQDHYLSEDYDTEIAHEDEANELVSTEEDSIRDEVISHRQAFCKNYTLYYEIVKSTTHLINNAKYDKIVSAPQ
jgi:hypothetical protein